MASNNQQQQEQDDEQLQFLHECYPQESTDNLRHLLQKYNSDVDQVYIFLNLYIYNSQPADTSHAGE